MLTRVGTVTSCIGLMAVIPLPSAAAQQAEDRVCVKSCEADHCSSDTITGPNIAGKMAACLSTCEIRCQSHAVIPNIPKTPLTHPNPTSCGIPPKGAIPTNSFFTHAGVVGGVGPVRPSAAQDWLVFAPLQRGGTVQTTLVAGKGLHVVARGTPAAIFQIVPPPPVIDPFNGFYNLEFGAEVSLTDGSASEVGVWMNSTPASFSTANYNTGFAKTTVTGGWSHLTVQSMGTGTANLAGTGNLAVVSLSRDADFYIYCVNYSAQYSPWR